MNEFQVFTILIVLGFIVQSVWIVAANLRESGKGIHKRIQVVGSLCLFLGASGFFSAQLYSSGFMKYIPSSFEWPLGYARDILRVNDYIVAPLELPGRIQVYDASLKFQLGWAVNAKGGVFVVESAGLNEIFVYTARGNMKYHYNLDGELLSASEYSGRYPTIKKTGEGIFILSGLYKLPLMNPFIGFALLVVGYGIHLAYRFRRKNLTNSCT